jgi:EAL domain-containing protein (putative c-di-GMP-specific phosphodiesterase class I)
MSDLDVLQLSLQEIRETFSTLPVTLEIHEAAVTSPKLMHELRSTLDDLGYLLAYDDFGSGQARLIELIEVPPHVLKFDLALTRDIDHAPAHRQRMLASLVQMACDLGIQPLAEGMETRGEAETCLQLGFELSQGFFYGEPVPVEDLLGC